ncbi:uncharacterized protein LOC105844209 [Hydra vulgaris]|uniref:Uncharacterized protein LOC105844209 n=1 Tax=Hydra vulgaris TaxID=6087 RepID=A0ABM4B8C4_HYDVU
MSYCDDSVFLKNHAPKHTRGTGRNSFDKAKMFGSRLIRLSDSSDNYQYDYDYLQMEFAGMDAETGYQNAFLFPTTSPVALEDNSFNDKSIIKGVAPEKRIEQYMKSFSLHGLTKIFVARTRLESLFWLIALLGGISLSMYVSVNLVTKYLNYEVYTDAKLEITDKNFFPAVTMCERDLLQSFYFSYCGLTSDNQSSFIPCQNQRKIYITTDNKTWWSNGLFNVTLCTTWGAKQCVKNDFFLSLSQYNHACIRWNYDGNLYDMYSHVDIEFTFISDVDQPSPNIILISHDPLVSEIDFTNAISLEAKQYSINMEKTIIELLPSPFPSKCKDDKDNDMFPGKYTRRSCLETQNYIGMFKECGDIFDYMKQYIPKDILQKYKKNDTKSNFFNCMYSYSMREAKSSSVLCPFPCSETQISMVVSSRNYFKNDQRRDLKIYSIGIQYTLVDSYRIVKEKQLYYIHQLACEIGGLIGLMVGFSLISAIEIVACSVLWLMCKIRKLTKY